jgi:DNA-binding PadR family transcriptional regulator
LISPQGVPRGLLRYYILHRISIKPIHGYEILKDIEGKTEGAWRPGPGSIYPILKWLLSKGYVKPDKAEGETSSRIYQITPKGTKFLEDSKEIFSNAGKRWSAMRNIFIDILDSEQIVRFFIDGSQMQFQLAQEIFRSRIKDLPTSEIIYMLKEYLLNLERQTSWAAQNLENISE